MNAVEIEEAVSDLALQPFDPAEFAFRFLAAFSARDTTLKRLRKGDSNQSDVAGGVLWRGYIHIAVATAGEVGTALAALRASPRTTAQKAKFILATDGATDLIGGDVIACAYADLPRQFATFLPLAGISTVKEIKNNPIDVKATGRLNKLYVELLKDNPNWATEDRRHELNQFMARLIFCFFAEDTGIFRENQFTATIAQMSHAGHGSGDEQWGNTHDVLTEMFRAMDTPVTHDGNLDPRHRIAAGIRPYADVFPYVNGGLFTGATDSPRFSRTARAYLLRAGELDWKEINPDIFGSMIQAVADDGERGELGMHYTSVPNILKVLNPLFLDDLRETLETAGDSRQRLRNLRKRLGSIRVFDPACGSGNFLVIAYKEMRAIEAAIIAKLGGEDSLKLADRRSVIPLSNFYGIEIKGFAAEIARLALLIAEFQADCLYLSQQEARAMVLPLHKTGQVTVGNALQMDWLEVCPPARGDMVAEHDLAGPTGRLALDDNRLEDGVKPETYICGNPPYKGSKFQSLEQKSDIQHITKSLSVNFGALDYVSCWFLKATMYSDVERFADFAFVSTNSICQGQSVPTLWPHLLEGDRKINFAYESFAWTNLASYNAAVIVIIIGVTRGSIGPARLYSVDSEEVLSVKRVDNINAYLVPSDDIYVEKLPYQLSGLSKMESGSKMTDGSYLVSTESEVASIQAEFPAAGQFFKRIVGGDDLISGRTRWSVWIEDDAVMEARSIPPLAHRLEAVRAMRAASSKAATRELADDPHRFDERRFYRRRFVAIPQTSSERREWLSCDYFESDIILIAPHLFMPTDKMWELSLILSKLHLIWIATICGKLKSDYRYSNTMGWNTFPVPKFTEQDRADLTRTAENILLVREAHFPATIADLYDPHEMPDDLRRAHDENDEVLERIYIGRRFRNDTERLEKLFDLYTKMTANAPPKGKTAGKVRKAT